MAAVLNFYSFTNIEEPELLMQKILRYGKRKLIKGSVILAFEGFNVCISAQEKQCYLFVDYIKEITGAKDIECKVNYCDFHPFRKLKVKIKPEIVTMKVHQLDISKKGLYVNPESWDALIAQDDVVNIDVRNDYEVEAGSFKRSLNPFTKSFSEFALWVDKNIGMLKNKKVAMFCTGGIRCEKASAYMKTKGCDEVYHLKGGILQYLHDTKNKNKFWEGECFVFDDRELITDGLEPKK